MHQYLTYVYVARWMCERRGDIFSGLRVSATMCCAGFEGECAHVMHDRSRMTRGGDCPICFFMSNVYVVCLLVRCSWCHSALCGCTCYMVLQEQEEEERKKKLRQAEEDKKRAEEEAKLEKERQVSRAFLCSRSTYC